MTEAALVLSKECRMKATYHCYDGRGRPFPLAETVTPPKIVRTHHLTTILQGVQHESSPLSLSLLAALEEKIVLDMYS